MCARRFLLVIFILTLLAVAGAFAIYQWGGRVLVESATPRGHFEAAKAGTGPDYARHELWIARPDMDPSFNPAEWRPAGFPPPRASPKPAAAFYIHPTTYLRTDRWNAPLRDFDGDWRDRLFVQSQASAFNPVADVWAPRYRQAAYGAFLLRSEDARQALDLAYSDVSVAFGEFLRQSGDKPLILAGHSQGALHLIRLIHDHKTELKGRLIAAYVVGWPISTAADLPSLGIPACRVPDQTGCVLSWMSFAEPANPSLILNDWSKTEGPNGEKRRREDILCVNPISGRINGSAPPQDNPGTLVPSADFTTAALVKDAVGAHCNTGLLILDGDVPRMGPYVLPGNNYHVYDYALFWWPIARDAFRRTEAWKKP
jgi:hypothetical protein